MLVAMMLTDQHLPRERRVPFARPVRVVPLVQGPPRAYRLLSTNLSRGGIFLSTPTPFEEGTQVALSLEAGGRVLPFAQGEVRWGGGDAPAGGVGVKFTGYLHPRAQEMVDYLVAAVERGSKLELAPFDEAPKSNWLVGAAIGAVMLLACTAFFVFSSMRNTVPEPGGISELPPAIEVVPPARTADDPPTPASALVPPPAAAVEAAPVEPAAAPVPAPVPVEAAPAAVAPAPVPPPVVAAKPATPAPTSAPAKKAGTAGHVALPKSALKGLSWSAERAFTVELSGNASIERAFLMSGPSRLVIDLSGAVPAKSFTKPVSGGTVVRVRLGLRPKGTRVVIDLATPASSVAREGNTLTLR